MVRIPATRIDGSAMKVVLLRHGQSISTGMPLDELCPSDDINSITTEGAEQMSIFAADIRSLLMAPRLFSSEMRRATEGAVIIARRLGIRWMPCPELREILEVNGTMTHGELRNTYERFWYNFYCGDGADDLVKNARSQADKLVSQILREYRNDSDIIMVSHGGIIEVLMSRLLTGYAATHYTIEFSLQPGSFHLIEIKSDEGRITHLRLQCSNRSWN